MRTNIAKCSASACITLVTGPDHWSWDSYVVRASNLGLCAQRLFALSHTNNDIPTRTNFNDSMILAAASALQLPAPPCKPQTYYTGLKVQTLNAALGKSSDRTEWDGTGLHCGDRAWMSRQCVPHTCIPSLPSSFSGAGKKLLGTLKNLQVMGMLIIAQVSYDDNECRLLKHHVHGDRCAEAPPRGRRILVLKPYATA